MACAKSTALKEMRREWLPDPGNASMDAKLVVAPMWAPWVGGGVNVGVGVGIEVGVSIKAGRGMGASTEVGLADVQPAITINKRGRSPSSKPSLFTWSFAKADLAI